MEDEFCSIFFNLMAEVECGDRFDFNNPEHIKWLKHLINIDYFRGVKFFAHYLDNKTPVGFLALLVEDKIFVKTSEVLDIGLFPKYRNKGYGLILMKYAEEYSRKCGVYCMHVSTYSIRYDIIAFYGKNGFVPVATLPDVNGPKTEGNVFMRKVLN